MKKIEQKGLERMWAREAKEEIMVWKRERKRERGRREEKRKKEEKNKKSQGREQGGRRESSQTSGDNSHFS